MPMRGDAHGACNGAGLGVLLHAQQAFQALVRAFERLTKPELFEDEVTEKGKPKQATLGRSNQGCHRTHVHCPRCNVAWGQKVEGNPDCT